MAGLCRLNQMTESIKNRLSSETLTAGSNILQITGWELFCCMEGVFFLNKINKGYAAFQAMNMTKRVSIVSKFPAESQEELEKECIKKTT